MSAAAPVTNNAAAPATAGAAPTSAPVANGVPANGAAAPAGATPGAPAAVTPFASASLYVGDLVPDVTEALLFEIFNAVGPVASVRVCRDASTRRSLGYAYVNFHRVDDAERALDTMNFKNIRNRPCRIMWSHRDPSLRKSGLGNIFVNHLAKSIDNKQLYDTFSMFGNILSCKVSMNMKRESLGYGFVHYENDESALNAIQRVDGKVIAGSKVSVTHFKSKKERGVKSNKFTNVFVKNLPAEITKETVEDVFGKYGTITSSVITVDRDSKDRAFAFINFEDSEMATQAVENMHDTEYEGRKLYVSRAQKREEREKELRERFEQLKQERQKKYAGVNLYLKNLADDMDDKKLTEEFSKFGAITKAAVMMDPVTKKSRGFGFVCFATPEEATRAVTEMNGKMIESKPLYVALAQRKEHRRAQLEAQYAARAKLGGGNNMGPGMNGPYGGMNPNNPSNPAAAMMFAQQAAMGGRGGAGYPQMPGYPVNQRMPMPMPGWNPQMNPNNMRGPVNNGNYQLMPVNARVGPGGMVGVGGAQSRGPAPRGPRGNQRGIGGQMPQNGGMMGKQQGNMGAPMGLQGGPNGQIRYTDNVRNRGVQAMGPSGGAASEQVSMPAPNEPLTIKALAAAPEEMRKQMIGERLFPLIKLQEPNLAGKITGMLLEMDNGELIHLLESQLALNEKIMEALQVLHANPPEQQEQETEA